MRALIKKIRQLLKDRRFRKIWYRGISATAAVVVFITTYALVLPAITMESEASCGIPAHQHTADCYEEQLICDRDESDGHHHTDDCYTVTKELTCTIPEHQHDESCFDEDGNLTCSQTEHTHDDTCYEEHRELTCGLEESEGHHHDSSCYKQVLTCGLEAHIHSTECYKEDSKAVTASTSAPASEDSATAVAATAASTSVPVEIDDSDNSSDESDTVSTSSDIFSDTSDISPDAADTSDKSDITDTDDMSDASEEDSAEDITDNENADQTTASDETSPASLASDSDESNAESENASIAATTDVLPEPVEQETLSEGYVPTLDPVNMDQVLDRQTGFYYYHAEEGEALPASSAEITSWKKVEDNTELAPADLVKAYFAYTIPAGTLNETNQVARYRLPANLHLTDDQIMAINQHENGISASYIDYDTLEILDSDNYHKYLGAEAIDGIRTPDQTLVEGTQEYISAVVKAENVYENTLDADGNYVTPDGAAADGPGTYLGQELIFIFTPYTIEKNQITYDAKGNPTAAGEKVSGWFACDFNLEQIDWSDSVETILSSDSEDLTVAAESQKQDQNQEQEKEQNQAQEQESVQEQNEADANIQRQDNAEEITHTVPQRIERTAHIVFVTEGRDENNHEILEISTDLKLAEVNEIEIDNENQQTAVDKEEQIESPEANVTVDSSDENSEAAPEDTLDSAESANSAEDGVNADDHSAPKENNEKPAEKAVPEYKDGTLEANGSGYKITMDYKADAKIPENAYLHVTEITKESDAEAYEACLEEARKSVPSDSTRVDDKASRFFDIEILVDEFTSQNVDDEERQQINEKDIEKEKTEPESIDSEKADSESIEVAESNSEVAENGDSGIEDTESEATQDKGTVTDEKEFENTEEVPATDNEETAEVAETSRSESGFAKESVEEQIITRKIEPAAPVSVNIQLFDTEISQKADEFNAEQYKVVHIAEDGTEEIQDVKAQTIESEKKESEPGSAIKGSDPDVTAVVPATEVKFEAESFSIYGVVYTVDFHWVVNGKEYEFSIPGGGFVTLEHLVEALGINKSTANTENGSGSSEDGEENTPQDLVEDGDPSKDTAYSASDLNELEISDETRNFVEDVEKVEFTSPELLWVGKVDSSSTVGELKEANRLNCEYSAELAEEQIDQINAMKVDGGDWALISLKAFSTEETLTVTMKDQSVFTIKVTDAQVGNELNGRSFVIKTQNTNPAYAMSSSPVSWEHNQNYLQGQTVSGADNQIWVFEYDSSYGGTYRIKSAATGTYLTIGTNDYSSNGNYNAYLSNSPALFFIDNQNGNYSIYTYYDGNNRKYLNFANNYGTPRFSFGNNEQRFTFEETQSYDPVGDWLLYFDDDFDEVTIHVGETITLRPYDRWEWKEGNADVQSKHWNIDGRDDNYWNQIDSNDGNGAHKETWSSGGSNGVAGFDWTAYVKKDTELVTHYWSVQGRATAVGDYTLTNTKNGKTITVHVVEGEPTTTPDPITNTVDFAVNLFDYDLHGTLDPSDNSNLANNNNNKGDSTNAMNGGSKFYFLSSGSGNNGADSWNQYTSGAAKPGIVKDTLDSEGYPQLAGSGQNSQSLKYLFDTSKQQWNGGKISDTDHYPDGMIAYPNVNGMFQKDDDGYYYFNSNTNYFYYNTETGESKLYQHTYTQTSSADKHSLVNDKPIGFFPFHDYEATDNLYVNQNSNLNHHLGMSMEIPFRMKADRKDANGNDIKFEFTGDDDLWVFAEWEDANGQKQSKLLLDIGGIHQPVYGAIDFTHDTSTSLKTNETMGLQPGVDYTLKVFYLERGGCDSNLAVRFNLPLTERGDIPFTKRDTLTNDPLPGAVFGLYTDEACTQKLRQATSGQDGHVLFTNVGIGTYYMKEITPPAGYNASTAVYRVDVKSKKKAEITLINGTDAPSDYSYNVDNRPIMLTVKKAWMPTSASDTADPVYFKLYKKGNPDTEIRNSYGYVNNKGYKLDGSNSWTATFKNLSQGQYYVVESPVPAGYTVMYAVGEDISAENLKETAKDASTDQNGNLTILNRQNKMDIGVEKTWEGINPTDPSLQGANIKVTLKRYKLVDILGTLKVTTTVNNSGDPTYDFFATYQVINSAGKVVKEFTATESAEHVFNDIPVGNYTVKETLAVPDPDLGYEITHDPALENGAVSHSISVTVTKNNTDINPALAAFASSYTPKVGQLTITKTVTGAPNGYSFDATYTVKRGETVIGIYNYSELSKLLTLPEGDYTVIESNVSADPDHYLSQHSSQTLQNIQVREGSPQTAEFTTTYTPANPVYVTAVHFQNYINQTNRVTYVDHELFYGGQTILICWRQNSTATNGNVLYINGNWYKGYGNANYREVEYVLPESGGEVLIEIADAWFPNGIADGADGKKITVKLKEENPDPEPAQGMSNGQMMMSMGKGKTPVRTATPVTQDNTVTPPSVPTAFLDSKIYVIDDNYTQTVDLTQNGNWKKTDISVDPVDEDGNPYYYFISNVTETGIEGRVTVTIDDKLVSKDNKDTMKLSLKNKVEKNGALELTKKVAGTGADEEKEFEFTIALTAPQGQTLADSYNFKKNGNAVDGITYTKDANDAAKATVTGVSLKHNDVFTIEDLPAGTTYLITEGNYSSEGYSSSLPAEGLGGTITGGNKEKESVTVTNTLSAGSLTVEKTLEGNATDGQKDFSFSVTFNKARLNGVAGSYKTGKSENIETATSEDITFASGAATVSFTLKGGEIAQFTGIPVGTTFTVSETSKDTNGYETSVSSTGGTVNSVEKTVTGSISATAAVTASYVNKKNKLEAEAVKQWKSGTQTITWPVDVEKVEFTLYKTVNGSTTPVTSADLTDYATAEQIAAFQNPVEITSTTEEKKAAWDNLPAKYWLAADANASPAVEAGWYEAVYSVKETKIFYTDGTEKDVNVAATEGVITNEVEKVRIHASKKWKDKNGVELDGTEGKEIPIGAQVTYTLVKDGTEVPAHAVILNGVDETKDPVSGGEITPQNTDYEGAGWTAWFTELPKYNDNGTLVIYSVKETGKWTGYEIEGSDSVGDEGTIYNKESSIDINILKVDKQNNKPLTGATFVLRRYDEGYHQVLETWDAQQVSAEAGKEGTLTFEKLQVGWYELEETISPTGYVKTTSNPRFTVTADQEGNLAVTFINSEMVTYDSTVQTFTVKNEPGAALPSTGGPGTTALYLLGIMLTGFAGAGLVMRKRRRDAA